MSGEGAGGAVTADALGQEGGRRDKADAFDAQEQGKIVCQLLIAGDDGLDLLLNLGDLLFQISNVLAQVLFDGFCGDAALETIELLGFDRLQVIQPAHKIAQGALDRGRWRPSLRLLAGTEASYQFRIQFVALVAPQ